MEFLIVAAIVGIGGLALFTRKRKKASKHPSQGQSVSSKGKKKNYSDKKWPSLAEQLGPNHCNGQQCNLNNKCQDPEIVFCHTILRQTGIPSEHIIGQCPVLVSANDSGIGRIDFAVKTPDGRALAIELDGHKSHTKLDGQAFDKHQRRQNELVETGWTVLRFTARDMNYDPGYCIDYIKKIYSTSPGTASPMSAAIIYADYDTKEAREDAPQKAAYSSIRRKHYTICTSANDFTDDKKTQRTFWVKCFKQGCCGEATRVKEKGPHGFYWRCKKCSTTYSDNNGIPKNKFQQT